MVHDFHTHTSLSDGSLSPLEMIRRAQVNDYRAVGLTDHVGIGYLERLIDEVSSDCALARSYWPILAIPGVELTHFPPVAIADAARRAKKCGAWLVVVHGETVTEPVEKGTNRAALECPHVDILAHPGLISLEEAELAAESGIFLEISSRKGHSLTNGHVARMARITGAKLLINSDAHCESDLLTLSLTRQVACGAGLEETEIDDILVTNVQALLNLLPSQG
jgi:putative hydrolase